MRLLSFNIAFKDKNSRELTVIKSLWIVYLLFKSKYKLISYYRGVMQWILIVVCKFVYNNYATRLKIKYLDELWLLYIVLSDVSWSLKFSYCYVLFMWEKLFVCKYIKFVHIFIDWLENCECRMTTLGKFAIFARKEIIFLIYARNAANKYNPYHQGSFFLIKFCDEHYWQKDVHYCIEFNQKPINKPIAVSTN